ncbi:hypothetical protein ACFS7Z_22710 [Pontibacter toksunensis]|uniref:Uncharacterized protein n=1 Tax=Pontibacter toksunensis TaxID=1332631 RepID=A0ABW6C1V0_9BACT
MKLAINQSVDCTVYAKQRWNSTGVQLEAGHTYSLEASGKWTDLTISSGPDGFTKWYMKWAEKRRRVKEANWFALIGTYGGDNPFIIGSGIQSLTAQVSVQLICFANDAEGFYWNNSGAVRLTVVRKS